MRKSGNRRSATVLAAAAKLHPVPALAESGDNTWQLVAATFVGLMSLPGLAVLYAGLSQRKWAGHTLLMHSPASAWCWLVWVLWPYNMGFGPAANLFGRTGPVVRQHDRHPPSIVSHFGEQNQAVSGANTLIPFHFPTSTLAYFQFVFAAITPLLFCGSVVARMKFKACC